MAKEHFFVLFHLRCSRVWEGFLNPLCWPDPQGTHFEIKYTKAFMTYKVGGKSLKNILCLIYLLL